MAKKCKPIGFFDSGVGGISVLKTAYERMPNENFIYYGDSLNAPYGEKSEEKIKELSLSAGSFLFSKGVKAIVMACNTATSAAVKIMRKEYNIPVISMEPAVKPALECAREGKVLVLATRATVSQTRYLSLLARLGHTDHVINVACSGLAELIEENIMDEVNIHSYLNEKLHKFKNVDVRAAVIGCTHYSFVKHEICTYLQKNFSNDIKLFDGRYGTVRQLQRVMEEMGNTCSNAHHGGVTFYTSGNNNLIDKYQRIFDKFNGGNVTKSLEHHNILW